MKKKNYKKEIIWKCTKCDRGGVGPAPSQCECGSLSTQEDVTFKNTKGKVIPTPLDA